MRLLKNLLSESKGIDHRTPEYKFLFSLCEELDEFEELKHTQNSMLTYRIERLADRIEELEIKVEGSEP